jgi:tRNA(Ile)-lysidine synthase
MTEKSWAILRPLLNLEKKEILEYLDKNNLKYFVDETNSDTEITRNYLRIEIIPKFYKINSNFKENINNTLKHFEEIKDFLDEKVKNFLVIQDKKIQETQKYSKIYNIFKEVDWYKWWFFINDFNSQKELIQKELIRYIYYVSNNKSTIWLSEANIAEIIKFINWKNNKTIKEIKGLKMFKENEIIVY